MPTKRKKTNNTLILKESLTYRLAVIIIDFFLLSIVFQSTAEAGLITIIRQLFQTLLFMGNEYYWEQVAWGTTKQGNHTRIRSFVKTILFRIITIASDLVILLFYVGLPTQMATYITILLNAVNTIFYYFHDRLWDAIKSRK